jgi:hypothetical protein
MGASMTAPVTIERIERAINVTARAMADHNLPQLLPTLKRLEGERDKLVSEGDPIAYAKRVLAGRAASIPTGKELSNEKSNQIDCENHILL